MNQLLSELQFTNSRPAHAILWKICLSFDISKYRDHHVLNAAVQLPSRRIELCLQLQVPGPLPTQRGLRPCISISEDAGIVFHCIPNFHILKKGHLKGSRTSICQRLVNFKGGGSAPQYLAGQSQRFQPFPAPARFASFEEFVCVRSCCLLWSHDGDLRSHSNVEVGKIRSSFLYTKLQVEALGMKISIYCRNWRLTRESYLIRSSAVLHF